MAVVKIIRIIGNSPQSWAKAAAAGAKEAARTVRNITGIEATDFTAEVDDRGNVTEYRCTLNVAFLLERGAGAGEGGRGGRSAGASGGEGGRAGGASRGGSAGRGRAGGGDGGARRR
jgi:flavin-binding protein dodecin